MATVAPAAIWSSTLLTTRQLRGRKPTLLWLVKPEWRAATSSPALARHRREPSSLAPMVRCKSSVLPQSNQVALQCLLHGGCPTCPSQPYLARTHATVGLPRTSLEHPCAPGFKTGDVAPGPNDDRHHDIVMMDDFIYGEPQLLE